ncbi:ribonuclease H-like protein [Lactarius vividus]|nr:ribonuclease H-like protein [Lactarius vividus]
MDGLCTNNGKLDTICGCRIWICADHPLNHALKVLRPLQSNQVGELAAIIAAMHSIPNYCQLMLITDSKYMIKGLTKHLVEWEDRGWIGIKNGHQGNLGNEESNKLAKEGVDKDQESQMAPNWPLTNQNMDTMREAIMTNRMIWRSIRKDTIHTRVQQFLFKAMHNTLMIGDVWFKIPGFKHRGMCTTCDTTETMEHILLACHANPVKIAWDLAKKLWPHRNLPWPAQINQDEREQGGPLKHKAATRLLQITILEMAHLIWVLRCKRVIQDLQHSPREIRACWLKAINRRLTDDKITATKTKGKYPLPSLWR